MAFRNLTRLFRAEPTHPASPATARQTSTRSVAMMDDHGAASERNAAVEQMPDGLALRQLAGLGNEAVPGVASNDPSSARGRIARLIDAGSIDMAALLAAYGSCDALLSIAAACTDESHVSSVLAAVDDPQRITSLVTDGSTSRVRQLAARRIEDPAELKRLLRLLRGKDKNVYKIVKDKCDALRAEELRVVQIASSTEAACATLERLSHRLYDALYAASLRISMDEWQALEPVADPSLVARAHAAIGACRAVIGAHERQIDERAARHAHHAAEQAARQEDAARVAARDAVVAAERREADAVLATQNQALQATQAAATAEREAAQAAKLKQLTGLIARTNAALRDGDTGRAAGMRRALESKLPNAPDVPAYITRQVQQLDDKLGELKQWKDYAVAPKRLELIADMEALIGSSEAPQALADRIKQLQEEWKTISKGIVSEAEEDWQRFHQASQAAYQPCRDYFEAQAQLRRNNLDARRRILERVKSFENALDPAHPDWRAVAAVLREAPQEFRRPTPVDRAAGRELQEEFDAVLARLRERVEAWYAQNALEKRALIERARAMLDKADPREAIDGIKHLQLLWKNVGSAEHREEQRLWEEFRAQCDAVFAKRQKAITEHAAGLDVNKTAAVCPM